MPAITSTQTAEITPEIIAQEALGVLRAKLFLARNVTKEMEVVGNRATEFTKMGKVITVPKLGTVSANAKSPNSDFVIQQPDMDGVQITVDQHWECTIGVDDYAQAIADRNIEDTYLGDMITALAEKIEVKIAEQFDNFSNTPIDATSADKDTIEQYVLQARKTLTDNRAPMDGRFGYWETGATNLLLQNGRFTEVAKYGSGVAIQEGELGKIHGFRSFESIFVPDDGGSPVKYKNALMHKRAICLAMRPLPVPRGAGVKVAVITDPESGLVMRALYSYNASKGFDQLTLDVLFGVGVLREELGVVVLTD